MQVTNVSISKIMQTIFNWLENKNVQLSKLLETFICLPICEHPQDHNRLGWKPYKNRVLLSHIIICIVLLRVFTYLLHSLRHFSSFFLFFSNIQPHLHLFHVPFFQISLINTVMLIMFAFDFVCIFNHPTSIQVRIALQT